MIKDRQSFYHSKEWEKLIAQIRLERVNDAGQIICEYCGKPIVKAYDCIGHHKIELTEENVCDYSISLNPMNIQLVHHRCHNFIHDKLGRSCREVFLVYGAPLSGKSTWVHENMSEGDLVVDIDNIWECVSGLERYRKPNRLKAVVFSVRDTLLDAVRFRSGKWNNAYVIGGYPFKGERERLCRELNAREVFIQCDRETCLKRLRESEERPFDEWSQYIDRWFEWAEEAPPTGI